MWFIYSTGTLFNALFILFKFSAALLSNILIFCKAPVFNALIPANADMPAYEPYFNKFLLDVSMSNVLFNNAAIILSSIYYTKFSGGILLKSIFIFLLSA